MIVAAADNLIIVGVSESCRAADQPAMASSSLLTFPINYWSEEKQYLTLPLSCII